MARVGRFLVGFMRASVGPLIVIAAGAVHGYLITKGVYRRYPIEWWLVAAFGLWVAWRERRVHRHVVPLVLAILLAAFFVWMTTVGTRVTRPPLALRDGGPFTASELVSDSGAAVSWPRDFGTRRANLLVFFRGTW